MENLEEKINKIPDQVRRWILYAFITPPAFLLLGVTLLVTNIINFGLIFWIGISILAVTSFIWWVWALYSIYKLTVYLRNAHNGINTAINELKEIRSIVIKS
jgi:hypothetical protein